MADLGLMDQASVAFDVTQAYPRLRSSTYKPGLDVQLGTQTQRYINCSRQKRSFNAMAANSGTLVCVYASQDSIVLRCPQGLFRMKENHQTTRNVKVPPSNTTAAHSPRQGDPPLRSHLLCQRTELRLKILKHGVSEPSEVNSHHSQLTGDLDGARLACIQLHDVYKMYINDCTFVGQGLFAPSLSWSHARRYYRYSTFECNSRTNCRGL